MFVEIYFYLIGAATCSPNDAVVELIFAQHRNCDWAKAYPFVYGQFLRSDIDAMLSYDAFLEENGTRNISFIAFMGIREL